MSNSIWKTGDPTYRNDNFDEIIVREYKRWATDGVFYLVDYCTELPNRWAYLLDIIAQADKAERLEEENEAMRDEFELWQYHHQVALDRAERLQKAVDYALQVLDDVIEIGGIDLAIIKIKQMIEQN